MQPHPSTTPVSLWTEGIKGAKINFPVLKGKPKMSKNQEQLTKPDLDFMKDFMSVFLGHGELMLKHLKDEADFYKETDKEFSDACYADLKKAKARMKKLAELQRKIKRMR